MLKEETYAKHLSFLSHPGQPLPTILLTREGYFKLSRYFAHQRIPANPGNLPPITSHSPSRGAAERSDQTQSLDNRSTVTGPAALFISIFLVIRSQCLLGFLDQTLSFRALAVRLHPSAAS